ncbi:hypothetical protein ACFY0Z_29460 [Streptomyces kronopolitis]|uniref:hypothetical protein n=1 Tax=Streptomyces kronopolitis TaxID=1612435 RepID=UPI003697BC75
MSAAEAGMRIGRSYTRARRMPWVMGKIGDWTLPFGPYTPAQIAVGFCGAFLLIKTFAWWRGLGPVPVVALAVAVWAVRRAKIGGRTPFNCALGLAAYVCQPRGGRIDGRAPRRGRLRVLHGGCVLEDAPDLSLDDGPDRAVDPPAAARGEGGLCEQGVQLRTSGGRLPRKDRRKSPVPQRPPMRPAPTAMQQMLRGRGEQVSAERERGAGS